MFEIFVVCLYRATRKTRQFKFWVCWKWNGKFYRKTKHTFSTPTNWFASSKMHQKKRKLEMFASQCKITRNYRYFRVFQVTIQSFSINGARSLFDYAQFCSARFFGWYDALKEVLGFCGVWCAHLKIAYFSVNNKHEFIPWISWKFSICPHNRQKKNAYYLFSLNKIIKAQQAKYLPAAMGIRPFYAIM